MSYVICNLLSGTELVLGSQSKTNGGKVYLELSKAKSNPQESYMYRNGKNWNREHLVNKTILHP